MGRKQAELVGGEVRSWHGLIAFSSELEVPARVQRPVTELPLFKDGLLCRKDASSCQYVCRNEKMMKEHWYTKHGWSIRGGGKGRQSRMVEEGLKRRFQEAVKQVCCQRFFPTFHGSQYFEVCRPEPEQEQEAQQEDQAQQPAQGGEQLWRQAWNKANQNWEELEKRARATIEEGE
ncbi:uncharacterized protein LTHEOB_12917, partial [Neofusicoccum parvum]